MSQYAIFDRNHNQIAGPFNTLDEATTACEDTTSNDVWGPGLIL